MKGIVKPLLTVFVALWAGLAATQDVVVETNPRNPVKGEAFQILFKCKTTSNAEPEISFDPEGFEVLGRQSQGVSTRTVYHQGRITTTRELLVSYEAMAPRAGRVTLRNLVVQIDGKRLTEPAVQIDVVDAPVEPQMFFVKADVPKRALWVGEGATIRYYVYRKVNLQGFDIKKFPKLTGFMKRYLQEPERLERVVVNGESYGRSAVYAARVYPERAGTLTIDSIEMEASYGNDPFAALGLGFGGGRMKTMRVQSPPVEIQVKELPTAGRPASFTGLVGPHQFELKTGGGRILVNEPLEARLIVSGPGNLENYGAPELWSVPELEKFDTKSDLDLVGGDGAIKTFDYTFLGKAAGTVAPRELELSWFDPVAVRYETKRLTLPPVVVGGGVATPIQQPAPPPRPDNKKTPEKVSLSPQGTVEFAAPPWWQRPEVWVGFLGLILLAAVAMGTRTLLGSRVAPPWEADLRRIERQGPDSASLTRVLHSLAPGKATLRESLEASTLPEESREYFQHLADELARREFATSRATGDIVADKRHMQALRKALKA